jgi:hypothetical protein
MSGSSAAILRFDRSRRPRIRNCAGCGSHFVPKAERHTTLCRRCTGWARAGLFLAAAAHALTEAERV